MSMIRSTVSILRSSMRKQLVLKRWRLTYFLLRNNENDVLNCAALKKLGGLQT